MADLSHAIKMKRNWFMNLFLWFWDAEGAPLNTCLIFWGTLGMIVGWPIRLLLAGVGAIIDFCMESYVPPVMNKPKESSRGVRFLTKLSDLGGAFWFRFPTLIRVLVCCALLALAGLVIYGLAHITWSWVILWAFLAWIGTILGAFALTALIFWWSKKNRDRPKRHLIRRIYHAVHDHTCANVVIE
jgi:hypothetical protein